MMKQKTIVLLVIMGLFFSIVPVGATEVPIPAPSRQFYVLDQANVLDQNTEGTIVQTSAALAEKTRAQVVVVTINSLEDYSPEEYALAILRTWGIGDAELNNGVLILVSPQERVSRIEVGYGLEGALPDGKTGRFQDDFMLPYFQQGDYNQGIFNGYLAVAQEVAKEYQVDLEIQEPQSIRTEKDSSLPLWANVLIFFGIIVLFYLDNRFLNGFLTGILFASLLRGGGRRGGRGGGSGGGFGGFGGSGGGGGSTRRW